MDTPRYLWTQIDAQGRLVVPAEIRKLMGLAAGDRLAFVVEDGAVSLMTVSQGIARSQAIARKYVKRKPGQSLVDEFIAERRAEAARE